ncbi:extensin-like domain-containing protein [Brevirhabdus sp.]|uniref:extensin-like domain-containing protein n=1 Tax=Brevirhabdus sp. TaxID=2004514 RepID=UPI0040594C26
MRRLAGAAALCALLPWAALAAMGPERSARPLPRPLPRMEAGQGVRITAAALIAAIGGSDLSAVARSARPLARPRGLKGPSELELASIHIRRGNQRIAKGLQGSVCGDPNIRGRVIDPVRGRGSCGIPNAVRVEAVEGVRLSTPTRMDCNTAKALKSWVRKGVNPTLAGIGGGADVLRVAAGYSCRTRNSRKGAKLSEHARGRAIDISGITLKNGATLSVLKGWSRRGEGRRLRRLHSAACGPFGTVLGPDSDRYHKDHFHLDTARYRSGSYCR